MESGFRLREGLPVLGHGRRRLHKSSKASVSADSLIASGGVNQLTAADFILAGATAPGIGRDLIRQDAIKRREREWVHELARRHANMVARARGQLAALRNEWPQ